MSDSTMTHDDVPVSPQAADGAIGRNSAVLMAEGGYPLNGDGLAMLYADRFGDVLRWSADRGWLAWDGKAWVVEDSDAPGHARVRLMLAELRCAGDDEIRKLADRSGELSKFHGVLGLARSVAPISVSGDWFDRSWETLNTLTDVVDLRTGDAMPHDPALGHTRVCAARYDWVWQGSLWDWFLTDILDDAELREWLQMQVGQSLFGRQMSESWLIVTGDGGDGKSSFQKAVLGVLGSYGHTTKQEFLAVDPRATADSHSTSRVSIRGKRMVVTPELPKNSELSVDFVKLLTGRDSITARVAHGGAEVTFMPSHSLWTIGNGLPRITSTDRGIWRRVNVIPFERRIPDDQMDGTIDDRLATPDERAACLAWAIQGARMWWERTEGGKRPLPKCAKVARASQRYRDAQDVLGAVLDEICVITNRPGDFVPKPTLIERVREAYKDRGHQYAPAEVKIAETMERWKVKDGRPRAADGKRAWIGIRLRTPGELLEMAD